MKRQKKQKNYINNDRLLELIEQYNQNEFDKQVANELGEALMLIAKNVLKKSNFSKYTITWKQDMLSEAVLQMFLAIKHKRFDITKSKNPFSYFSQICFNGILMVLKTEKYHFINTSFLNEEMA